MLDDFRGHMTTSKYAKCAKCSSDTALRDMRELVARNILIQNPGGGRSTSYRLITAEELEQSGDGVTRK
jgi:Fic family protein